MTGTMGGKRRTRNWLLILAGTGMAGVVVILSVLTVVSRVMPVHTFELGEHTSLGMVDPHLEIVVIEVEYPDRWGEEPGRSPEGTFHLLTLELRSSAVEMETHDGKLNVLVFDADGQRYLPLHPLTDEPGLWRYPALKPGQSGRQRFLFDLPSSVREPQLWVTSRTWITQLLPGGERSRFQPKLVFYMERADAPAQPRPEGL